MDDKQKIKKLKINLISYAIYTIIFAVGAKYLVEGYGGAKILGYVEIALAVLYFLLTLAMALLLIAYDYAQHELAKKRASVDISKPTDHATDTNTNTKQDEKKEDI